LGDAISPTIIGLVSDATGSLLIGVLIVPAVMFMAALFWGYGWLTIPEHLNLPAQEEEPADSSADELLTSNEQSTTNL